MRPGRFSALSQDAFMLDFSWLFQAKGAKRSLTGFWALAFNLTAIGFSLFYLYTSGFGLVSTQSNRGV
jgi:TRAP-type uncharacterized transport system fused permease subunit